MSDAMKTNLPLSDKRLLTEFRYYRSEKAFRDFFKRHEKAVFAFAAVLLKDFEAARDVTQEVFIKVASNPGKLLKKTGSDTARPWLLKVARDLSIDALRRRGAESRALENRMRNSSLNENAAAGQPDDAVEKNERIGRVRNAIEGLPARFREVLELKLREELSYREIAEVTGLTPTHVGVLIHRALIKLRELLNETGREK